jgi:hypothetical protein
VEFAGLDHQFHITAKEGEIIRMQFELDYSGTARIEADSLETFQFSDRSGHISYQVPNVQLHDFLSGYIAQIRQLDTDYERIADADLG